LFYVRFDVDANPTLLCSEDTLFRLDTGGLWDGRIG
jgi:hypothetical protein